MSARDVYLVTYRPRRARMQERHFALEADSPEQVRSLLAREPWLNGGRLEIVSLKQLLQ